ncbi:hypothetical protein MAR_032354 [Mya arenaria]|uniref:CARD domain-containing protein n=1 Tax=Mya arenaria TaxID=6604 RepID=A0ABY7F6I9_MYAAR|nr:uncharacterized protein LOC128205657 [Mya arenaria]WAR17760.1 hypothetical protein MAR_032354 [Mya arenaria]
MNDAQRRVLRNQHGTILKNLVLDTDILGLLLQRDALTENMVQTIQSKASQHEKIIELLLMLPKRGPKAFPVFLEAVRKHSSFLADKLETDYEKEHKHMIEEQAKATETRKEEQHAHHDNPHSRQDNPHDLDLSSLTGPQHTPRAATNQDKAFEKSFRTKEQYSERRHSLSISTANHAMTSSIVQQNLNTLYTKMKSKLQTNNTREHSFASPEPATFKMVDKLLEELFHNLEEYEMTSSQCHALFGGKDRNYPLVSHIINIQKAKRELEQDLKTKDIQKNKYADHISKLENRCRNQATEVNHLNEEIKKLKEELEKLQAINSEREEKQKIIDELRKMVMDADTSKKSKLRSSYLALHYDSNSTEIKQLRAEVRSLMMDNENLKTENLMLKKSENMKKLAKLREDQTNNPKLELKLSDNAEKEESRDSASRGRTMVSSHSPYKSPPRKLDTERPSPFLYLEKSFVRASNDSVNSIDKEADTIGRVAKGKGSDLDFKFSETGQNVSLGQKRSPSKDRSNKRVTFLSDIGIGQQYDPSSSESKNPKSSPDFDKEKDKTNSTPNGHITNVVLAKPEKAPPGRGRTKQSSLKARATSKRSSSLNIISNSRDIMKMSSQLIQKSRNLRQPTTAGH